MLRTVLGGRGARYASAGALTKNIGVSPEKIYHSLHSGEYPLIIDIRPRELFEEHRVIGAHNIPHQELEQSEKCEQIDKDQRIYLYNDGDDNDALEASLTTMRGKGFAKVRAINGGLYELYQAGVQTVRLKGGCSWDDPPFGEVEPNWFKQQKEQDIKKIIQLESQLQSNA